MICPKCKKNNSGNAGFCGYCGKRLEKKTIINVEKKAPKEDEIIKDIREENYRKIIENQKKYSDSVLKSMDSEAQNMANQCQMLTNVLNQRLEVKDEKASVVKRGIVGGLIAGPACAVVGALSAVDKNINNKK